MKEKIIAEHYKIGNLYLEEEKPDLAIEEYKQIIELDPLFANAWYKSALAYWMKGDETNFEKNASQGFEIDPHSQEIYYIYLIANRVANNNENKLDFSERYLTDNHMDGLVNFLNEHPEVINLDLSDNKIGDEGLKKLAIELKYVRKLNIEGNIRITDQGIMDFALYNKHITGIYFHNGSEHNREPISLITAAALASNTVLNEFRVNTSELGMKILNDDNPLERCARARKAGIEASIPSLKQLTIFTISNNADLQQKLDENQEVKKIYEGNARRNHSTVVGPTETEEVMDAADLFKKCIIS